MIPVRPQRISSQYFRNRRSHGFTLIELLVVIGIIILMTSLGLVAVSGLKGAGDFTQSLSQITGTFEQARAYAMANNCYVYVGILETNDSNPANDYTSGNDTPVGRLNLATLAVTDGTRGYPDATPDLPSPLNNEGTAINSVASSANNPLKLKALSKIQSLHNIHLIVPDSSDTPAINPDPEPEKMKRPKIPSDHVYYLGAVEEKALTTFAWSVGANTTITFEQVLQFTPQGLTGYQDAVNSVNGDTIKKYMEIALQPSQGNKIPDAPGAKTNSPGANNYAAIQIDGLTGAVRLYRP